MGNKDNVIDEGNEMGFIDEWNMITTFFLSIYTIIMIIFGILSENKWNLFNRLKKLIAYILNKDIEMNIALSYDSQCEFNHFKKIIKNQFENEGYTVNSKIDTKRKLDFTAGFLSISVLKELNNNKVFIEIERIGCGMKGLKNKINELLGILNKLSQGENAILNTFNACDIDISLPYVWSHVNINEPKKFNLKRYVIEFDENIFNSHVKIVMDKINIKLNTKEAIQPVLEHFI